MKKNWKLYLFYAFIFIFLFVLSYYFPYSNDDWSWGSQSGLDRLYSGYKDYNGRYLGNTLAIILTRSNILKSLFMSITYFGIGYLIKRIVNKNNNGIMIFSILMLFLINKCVFREPIVNTSLLEINLKAPNKSTAINACNKWTNKAPQIFEFLYDNFIDNNE